MDVPPKIIKGRTMLPLRYMAQALSSKINWDAHTRSVYISTGSKSTHDGSSQQTYHGTVTDPRGIKYIGEIKNGLPNGYGTQYWPNGNILREGFFVNGLQNGFGKAYWENGQLLYEEEWDKNYPNGTGIGYSEDGLVKFEGEFINGKLYSGKTTSILTGMLFVSEGTYDDNGNLTGIMTMYDKNGNALGISVYENGIQIQSTPIIPH